MLNYSMFQVTKVYEQVSDMNLQSRSNTYNILIKYCLTGSELVKVLTKRLIRHKSFYQTGTKHSKGLEVNSSD